MKVLLLVSFLLFPSIVSATTWYVDPVGGASGNAGTSEGAPKSALSQITVAAGDEIYFKKGTTHSGQITCVSGNSTADPTVYGSYGTGDLPVLTTNNNVFICQDKDFVTIENVTIRPTLSTAAGIRADRPQDITINNVTFDGTGGGLDGIRMEAISTGGSQTLDRVVIQNSRFLDFSEGDGIRMFVGATNAAVVSVGVTVDGNYFSGIGKHPARFSYQNASFGVRDHGYRSFTFTDNIVENSLLTTPVTVDDDQCLHFRNIRETTFGSSIIARNRITNCGRTEAQSDVGDTTLITGFWFEGMTNVIVADNIADDIRTPNGDGGAFFLDSNTAAADQYVTTGNHFLRNIAKNTNNNKDCVPYTVTQCNNSEGFSVTRGANANVFIGNLAYKNAIGFHVTGNAGANEWYHNTASANDYGFYLQTNSGDTPAGVAQVMRNNITFGNTEYDYRHGSSPKATRSYNIIGSINGDTLGGTESSANPKFLGPSSSDTGYKLNANSPACNFGTYTSSKYDLEGRRIGAYKPTIGAYATCYRNVITPRSTYVPR